jgi:hypothetical protein
MIKAAHVERCLACEADRSEPVERCLACEAVVSKEYDVTSFPTVRALPFEQAGLHDRARIAMGGTLRFSAAHHGLASEATLHHIP